MHPADPPELRWRQTSDAAPLTPGALHLWRIHTAGSPDDPAALALLSERQRQRWQRLRTPVLRARYLHAQAGCRRILGSYLAVPPADIALVYGAAGKPALADPDKAIEFNLTTTGDLALLAISADLAVGVDCELERDRPELLAIAARMLEPDQVRALAAVSPHRQQRAFYLAWTALEARVKEDGRGLARRRAADSPGLEIAHVLAGICNGVTAICAVARRSLPPPAEWQALELVLT